GVLLAVEEPGVQAGNGPFLLFFGQRWPFGFVLGALRQCGKGKLWAQKERNENPRGPAQTRPPAPWRAKADLITPRARSEVSGNRRIRRFALHACRIGRRSPKC